MQLKSCNDLIIDKTDFVITPSEQEIVEDKIPTDLKCIIDQDLFDQLMKLTEHRIKTITKESSKIEIKDALKDVLDSVELMMNLASEFLKYEALNNEKLCSSFLMKKIDFNMQEIERLFALMNGRANKEWDIKDVHDIVSFIKSILENRYHSAVCKKIRTYELKNCMRWIYDQVDREFRTYDEDYKPMKIGIKAFSNAKMTEKMRFLCVITLCEYFNYKGISTSYVEDLVYELRFDIYDNMDLHAIFAVCDIFKKQAVSENLSVWIWASGIMHICKEHKFHSYLMNCLLERSEGLIGFSKNYESVLGYCIAIFDAFFKFCGPSIDSRYFTPKSAVELMNQFKYFHQVRIFLLIFEI
jgi:hypothetical protein